MNESSVYGGSVDGKTVRPRAENNQAQRVEITTGISNDLDIAVTSGLEKGMKVITAGSVTEGSNVKIVGSK